MNGDDAVRLQRLKSKADREEASLDCMIFMGWTVMEEEKATTLFYSLEKPITSDQS